MTDSLRNWNYNVSDDGIGWLTIDKADSAANVLSGDVMEELASALDHVQKQRPKALIVRSAKKSGFIAGADIKEFAKLKSADEAYEVIRLGQKVLDRLEALPMPTIALINGFALGGGLELALACDYRIVVDDDKARLGLPEVKLGIHPGFGGTVRAVDLVGVMAAMDLMLTGRGLRPRAAKRIGLVDQVVAGRHLERAARMMALKPPAKKKPKAWVSALKRPPARQLVAMELERQTAKKANRSHYPAPFAMIRLWREHGGSDLTTRYEEEARSIAELMCSDTSRNLVRVFMLQDRLKSLGRDARFDCDHVHVIGAGVMGGDIAAWCAMRGLSVTLQDREAKYLAPAIARAEKLFKKRLKRRRAVEAAMDRLQPDVAGNGVRRADVLIEAIYENVEAKQALFRDVEPKMKPDAIIATNTSSIRLEDLSPALSDPSRLIGLHFFNPVPKMPLVEIIHGDETRKSEVDKGLAFARRIGKFPLPCKSSPGFVVNRVLMPYMMEAMRVGEEGVPLAAIDKASTNFGMPMGPVELADTVGLDVALSVAGVFEREFGMPVSDTLKNLVEKKQLGRKTGKGFYEYKKGKPVKEMDKSYQPPPDLGDRLLLPLINESVALLREGVVEDKDLLDAGVIFGTGFAPFTGGPIHYAETRGISDVTHALAELSRVHGERFEPDAGWADLEPGEIEHGAAA